MRFFDLLRFLSTRPAWIESPSIIPAQSPPLGKIKVVSLGELREEMRELAHLRAVTTE